MKKAYLLIFILLIPFQETLACSCGSIPSFKSTVSNIDKESNILILGELSEFLDYDPDFPSLLPTTEQYSYVTVRVIEDYLGSTGAEKVLLSNGPQPACIKAFNYSIGSQLVILASKTDRYREGKQIYVASSCVESVLYYDRENDIISGNITPYNSFLIWLYDLLGKYRYQQDKMTLKQFERLISSSLK